jgi:PAS domain S-box-containing protein
LSHTSNAFPGSPDFSLSNDPFFLTTAETTEDCIRLLDTQGRVQFMNRRGQVLLEIESWERNRGVYWPELLPNVSFEAAHLAVQAALRGEVARFRAYCPTARGGSKWWDNVVAPVHARQSGEIIGLLAMSHDATAEFTALRFLEAVIESVPFVVLVKDAVDGRIQLVNHAAEELYGLPRDQLIGKTNYDPFTARQAEHFERTDRQAIDSGALVDLLADAVETQRGLRYFRTRKVVIDGPAGPQHVVSIIEDVTEQREGDEALKLAVARAEAANHAKSEFLANMSHEIRTPLNGVVSVADVLAGTTLDTRQREMIEIIRTSSRTLERVLSDVLDLSRVEADQLELKEEPFELARAIRDLADLQTLRAEAKGLSLTIETAAEADGWRLGDVARLKQVLGNLLDNAIKFTEAGRVSLRVEPQEQEVRFVVSDTGVGFDPNIGDRLFERFQQADGSITRRFGGSGLGLAIARRLAELMGGHIDFDSRIGQGSWFAVTLPMPAAPPPTPAHEPAVSGRDPARAPRVLVVDDHPTNRKILELCLELLGADIVEAEDGGQAVEAFASGRFDVILMDMQMPVMDGLTATRLIRERERAQAVNRTPIVMVTANALPEHVRASLDAGADRHVPKPVSATNLIATITELLGECRDACASSEVELIDATGSGGRK